MGGHAVALTVIPFLDRIPGIAQLEEHAKYEIEN